MCFRFYLGFFGDLFVVGLGSPICAWLSIIFSVGLGLLRVGLGSIFRVGAGPIQDWFKVCLALV